VYSVFKPLGGEWLLRYLVAMASVARVWVLITAPERHDRAAAEALVATLALLNERAFSHALTTAKQRADLIPVQQRLLDIWQRALGLPDDSPGGAVQV
jgi:hypothetical protein